MVNDIHGFLSSKAFFILSMGLAIGLNSNAFAISAGGMEGGGGNTVVCRNPNGTIRSAEVLDLYEGRTVYQLPYQESPHDWKSQALDIFQAANIGLYDSIPPSGIYGWFENASRHLTFLPPGTSLKPVHDSLEVIIPDGCALEQTVNYQNDNLILVSGSIWQVLSETQKAALIIHESVYRLLRSYGETDSRRARHFTAYIVSGHSVETPLPDDNYQLNCVGGNMGKDLTDFYLTLLPSGKLRLQFDWLGGRKLLSLAYDDFDRLIDRGANQPALDILEDFKNPNQGLSLGVTLNSLFEPGDQFSLLFRPNSEGKWGIQLVNGTSIVDDSPMGPIDIQCIALPPPSPTHSTPTPPSR